MPWHYDDIAGIGVEGQTSVPMELPVMRMFRVHWVMGNPVTVQKNGVAQGVS